MLSPIESPEEFLPNPHTVQNYSLDGSSAKDRTNHAAAEIAHQVKTARVHGTYVATVFYEMPVVINAPPLADFTRPLDVLRDCHRRIERFLTVLATLAAEPVERDLDEKHSNALSLAIQYFQIGLPLHTADEEQSLFPRLREASDARARPAIELLAQLESEHREKEQRHRVVQELTTTWLQNGSLSQHNGDALRAELRALEGLYREHILREETEVLPIAASILRADEIQVLAHEMKERRRNLAADWAPFGTPIPDTRAVVTSPGTKQQ